MTDETVRKRYPDAVIEVSLFEDLVASALAEVAFSELIENAVKHAEGEVPHVRVTDTVRDDEVVVGIEDDCPPLPELEHRVLTGEQEMNNVYHSTGLGPWLVYWVVDLSDGSIAFGTSDESGNTVTVSLPRARTPPPG